MTGSGFLKLLKLGSLGQLVPQSSGEWGVAPPHPEPVAALLVQAMGRPRGALSTVDQGGQALLPLPWGPLPS